MTIQKKHICRRLLLLLAAGIFCMFSQIVSAQSLRDISNIVDISYVKTSHNVILKYTHAPKTDRFIFEFSDRDKVPYEIRSDRQSTTISFYRTFNLETQNLYDFPQYANITQKKLSERGFEITFPLPLATSFEHLNSIILDLHPTAAPQSDGEQREVTPLQISSLSFSWNTPVALAVFKREKYLWIVFNQYQMVDTNELIKNAGNMVKDIIQLPHTSATILRVEAADEIYSEVRKEGLLWIVDLYNRKADRNLKPIKVTSDVSIPGKPFLQVDLPHTEDIFSFLDPEVGDMLMAITSSEAGYAFLDGYTYPDFSFLPTSQGMAVNSDDFDIAIIRNNAGFILQTTQKPLNISKNLEQMKLLAEEETGGGDVNITQDLTLPIIKKTFEQSEKFLKQQIKIAPKQEKGKFYLELARFYLSYGLGSNAHGVLDKVENSFEEKDLSVPARIRSLIGVSLFLMKRYEQAFNIFNQPEISSSQETALWRSLADTDSSRDNSLEIIKHLHFIHHYPIEIKRRVAIRGIEYALEKKNDELAQRFLNILRDIPMDNELFVLMNYFDAEKIRIQGYFRSALPAYKVAALSSSNKYSALARYRIADFNSQIAENKLTHTIQEFERLKFLWGEKDFKIQVLNKLVDLYLKTNNFYMALRTLSEISRISNQYKPAVEQRMIQIMEEIYYYNNDNLFSPIKALALFDDFGYLIARSRHQTAITIKLADRLVAVDLLDRAYKLLENYLQKHEKQLSHTEISAMGSRMALINLFKNEENKALTNLRNTQFDDIPQTLALQRRIIEAQAFVRQGNTDKALELLGDDTGKNAILLKTEIYWNSGQWNEASDAIRSLIEKPKKDTPLSDEQMRYILDWLTALKQAGKETVIVRARNTFMPYFEKTPYASIFSLLTDVLEKDKLDMKEINKTIKDVQSFSNFAKQYTQSLIDTNLTENNANQ